MYETVGIYKYDEIIGRLVDEHREKKIEVFEGLNGSKWEVRIDSERYGLFKREAKCKYCKIAGTFFLLQFHVNKEGQRLVSRPHFNLYGWKESAVDPIMLTLDHIRAKANGGLDSTDNYQTLCRECNGLKGELENPRNQEYKKVEVLGTGTKALSKLIETIATSNNPVKVTIPEGGKICRMVINHLKSAGFYVKRSKRKKTILVSKNALEILNQDGRFA